MNFNHLKFLLIFVFGAAACGAAASSAKREIETSPTPKPPAAANVPAPKDAQIAVFAGGCFWGVEAVFEHIKGVSKVTSGYSGGTAKTADYETVSTGKTGHAEAVEVTFDPSKVTYEQLLKVFFAVAHDPTELNRQGPDSGTQYRSAIFYTNAEQQKTATDFIAKMTADKTYDKPIVTQINALEKYYEAEDYHQDYLVNHPTERYIVVNDQPKVDNLRKTFPDLYK